MQPTINAITWDRHERTRLYIASASDADVRTTYVEGLLRWAGGELDSGTPTDLGDAVALFMVRREWRRRFCVV